MMLYYDELMMGCENPNIIFLKAEKGSWAKKVQYKVTTYII